MMKPFSRICILLLVWSVLAMAEAVDFEKVDLEGNTHRLSDYRGKWVLVNYWATWCPPCKEEMPDLEMFHDTHKDKDAVVLGINHEDASLEQLQEFQEDYFISFPLLRGSAYEDGINGPLEGLPTSYLIDPSGEIVAEQVGMVSREAIESFIEKHHLQTTSKE